MLNSNDHKPSAVEEYPVLTDTLTEPATPLSATPLSATPLSATPEAASDVLKDVDPAFLSEEERLQRFEADVAASAKKYFLDVSDVSLAADAVKHPFPAVNPCARSDAEYDAAINAYLLAHKWGRAMALRTLKVSKHVFTRFAPPCQCCAGMRIALLAVVALVAIVVSVCQGVVS